MKEQIKKLANYIPEEPLVSVKQRLGLKKLVRLSANENPFGTSDKVEAAVKNWNFAEGNRYPDGDATDLRRAVAEKLQVSQAQLVFGVGLDEIITMISRIFLQPGDQVIQTSPTFSEYALHAQIEGAQVIDVPCDPTTGKHDLSALLAQITDKTRLIWVCNPNNPTGAYTSVADLTKFLAEVPPEVLVVIDEAYIDYVTQNSAPSAIPLVQQFSNAVVLRTFSKAYGLANYRVGYAYADPKIVSYLQSVRLPYNLNSLTQTAALAALADQSFVASSVSQTAKERENWANFFQEQQIKFFPSQANFMFFYYPGALSLADYLLHHGFQLRKGLQQDWLRLTISGAAEGAELRKLMLNYRK